MRKGWGELLTTLMESIASHQSYWDRCALDDPALPFGSQQTGHGKPVRCSPMRLLVFGLLLVASTALAQLAPMGPQTAYEGQNVSTVSLIANPHRDLAPLLPLVAQETGAPYDEAKIQATAEALKQAGGFPKVEINVEPEVSGLRINFLLEPAYYLGIVDFPGLGKYFSYTRLLQVANLQDEDPYDPSRIPLAENALRDFLRKNGYFQAKVHAEPTIDD